ncbi:PEPxxWA-CTERM sorting domain-containing protein [Sphingomonas sp. M1-B02]|uniref:PEPxxWA-CTERM sorting domain-containing protein n=1 Tax=Sphingomonas sp. M1-B02 TaxID=3114300 RepID=UPI0022405333|nr:PEPxxWA-CTERM sorting domain-containing protein [Sphingomonas sp. S6-11]UZK67671.1 PEPxxWA-CTERM sorting domain-containing protein [Sphingomonas sp. S6-11]
MKASTTIMYALGAAAAVMTTPAVLAQSNQTVTSTSQNVFVGGVNFTAGTPVGENTGGGSAAVTSVRPNAVAGDTGSLEIHGDRSRYVIGDLYGTTASPSIKLSDLSSFTFNWNVDQTTGSQLHAAPVARVIVADTGGARTELIWEHVYNGGASGVQPPLDVWNNAGAGDVWYANLRAPGGAVLSTFENNSQADTTGFGVLFPNGAGAGVLALNGNQLNMQLSSWAQYFSTDARVVGLSFGAGSAFGAGFTGFVDNAQFTTNLGTDTVNFEKTAAVSAVPEPATWAMMLIGFGAIGTSMRRRKSKLTTNVAIA